MKEDPPILVAPSILAADWSRLGAECSRAIRAGADWLHLDVMDGHFVDNISFGPHFVQTVHETNDIFLDVHLMIEHPDRFFARFVKAGASSITVHVEAKHEVADTLLQIRAAGCKVGLAMNPATPFETVKSFLDRVDLLLVMTVLPGFGGQAFLHETMEKVSAARDFRNREGLQFHIEVDGGIASETVGIAVENGANVLVAGTSLFKSSDMAASISEFRNARSR